MVIKDFILEAFKNFDFSVIQTHIVWVAITVFLLVISMAVDTISGTRKAKKSNIKRTSTGYKRLCSKAEKYFTPLTCMICIDILISPIVPIPAVSMLFGGWCIFCEAKSVTEKYYEKEELRRAERTLSVFIENKDDITKMVLELVRIEREKEEMLKREKVAK